MTKLSQILKIFQRLDVKSYRVPKVPCGSPRLVHVMLTSHSNYTYIASGLDRNVDVLRPYATFIWAATNVVALGDAKWY